MGLQAEQIADIVSMVKDAERPGTYTLLTTEFTDYPAMKRLFKAKGRRETGGQQLSFTAMVASNESAQTTSLFAEIDVNQADLFKKGRIPWRHVTNFYAFDEREPEINSNPEDLVDIIKGRRTDCFVDLAAKFEPWFWLAPTGSEAADDAPPYGIQYWDTRVNTDTAGAFQGGNPSGFPAGCAGLDAATYPKWQNWSVGYSSVSEDDFIDRLRKAAKKTAFQNPVAVPGVENERYGYYTNWDVWDALCKIGMARNDNLGYDLGAQAPMFMGTPIEYVPYLDGDSEDPFYGIDWSVLRPTFLRGEWMKETTVIHPGKQHRVVVTFVDSSLNIECRNRRKLFVLYKV
jgi:hypothetical protein